MDRQKKLGFGEILPLTLISAVLVCLVLSIALSITKGSVYRLYKDIGATPWHRPETVTSAEKSARYSDEDISKAMEAALKVYEEKWYTYNGVYLLELRYEDDFSESRQDENAGDWIYLRSRVYTGYADTVEERFRGKFHEDAYWAVEHRADGTWVCHGCADMSAEN
ncbi:hypothetical protein [Ruminococcus sp.]|uniref:hypothetical protein n=1 Tax=Ruminococcus sp. TaxID=41978 RepID=UPI0025E67120|nr:hypothetical protein [Ruminococcus sp.]MBQ8966374.1 hypothetical protein [Ruminococcus sp.]